MNKLKLVSGSMMVLFAAILFLSAVSGIVFQIGKSNQNQITAEIISTSGTDIAKKIVKENKTKAKPAKTTKKNTNTNSNNSSSSANLGPNVSLSLSRLTITKGQTSTLSWSVSGDAVITCVASGSWSGEKTKSGSVSVKPSSSSNYNLSCENDSGIDEASVSLHVKPVSSVVYCGGKSPCYSKSQIAKHNSNADCWGYNKDVVYNISSFASSYSHPGGNQMLGGPLCGNNIAPYLDGSASYNGNHHHDSQTLNNTSSMIAPYIVGYYDSSKP